jgi:S-adenosylmethionine synthetase
LEAAAGKNPVSHVGKLYNVAAGLAAQDLVAALPNVSDAECLFVSRIGAPTDEPSLVVVRLTTPDTELASSDRDAATEITRAVLARLPAISDQIVAGEIDVF